VVSPDKGRLAAVLLDFEGTLNDTAGTGKLYARDFVNQMSREHRVNPQEWVRALGTAMEAVRRFQLDEAARPDGWRGYEDYRRRELTLWVHTLMREAGLQAPDNDLALALGRRLEREIPLKMAPLDGALEAIAALSADGWRLFIASGAPSLYTRRCLETAGVAGSFETVYGPDVLDTLKQGTGFYRRAFEECRLSPSECAVVDDSPGPLEWAVEAGAGAVLAVGEAAAGDDVPGVKRVRNLSDLPLVLRLLKQ